MKTAIVVGAGAGGCSCALELANQGYQVELVEAGGAFRPFALKPETLEPLRKAGLFLDPRMISLLFSDMRVGKSADMVHVWGRGMGGTTNLATGNRVRYDGALRDLGVDLDQEFADLEELVPLSTDHQGRWNALTRQCWTAFEDLGFDPQVTPKMTHPGKCCSCGKCVLGCAFGAKWTADELLAHAPEGSINVHRGRAVERVLMGQGGETGSGDGATTTTGDGTDDGTTMGAGDGAGNDTTTDTSPRAQGVQLAGGTTLRADVVVLAAGGIGTPRILERSGIECSPTFFGDPVLCVAARIPGAKQDRSLPMPFIAQRSAYILAPYFDYLSFFFNKEWRMPAGDIFSLMIKLADQETGSVGAKGIRKELTDADYENLALAVDDCLAIFAKMGVPADQTFLGLVNEGHPGGTLPLTAETAQTLHPQQLPARLYVADSSLFPRSMGNPPIMTIMALAKKVARVIAAG